MRSIIRWSINNSPAINTLLLSAIIIGLVSLVVMRREVFPEFELDFVLVTVPYPGASPEEVESGICQKIEEAVRSVDGIKKQIAIAREGMGTVLLELEAGADAQKVLNEVRSEIDRIPSFPVNAEDPEVKQITLRQPAIFVGVIGPETNDPQAEIQLRDLAEIVRDELTLLPAVSQADLEGARDYQIDIEISEKTLRQYGLTLQKVADIVRRENLELPGGTIQTTSQHVLIKGNNKRVTGVEIAQIPLLTQPSGVVLRVSDLGTVRDEFTDMESWTLVNGKPGVVVAVTRSSKEDLLAMADAVVDYVAEKKADLPPGYDLVTWGDRSVEVRDRMDLLSRNGLQGLVLVLIVLALFLDTRLAFWVAIGIPLAILGACAVLLYFGHTLNMLTMFAFLMALGIVVDDAIVVSENIHAHRQRGKSYVQAALDGTLEVIPSVIASVTTTIIAFMPLFFVTGVMGKFIAVMPLAMIAMLLISLLESVTMLPCHLSHGKGDGSQPRTLPQRALAFRGRLPWLLRWNLGWTIVALAYVLTHMLYPFRRLEDLFGWLSQRVGQGLHFVTHRVYTPTLGLALKNPAVVVSIGLSLLFFAVALVRSGSVPFIIFPQLDSPNIEASITFPDGTPASVTDQATRKLEESIRQIDQKYNAGGPLVKLVRRTVGFAAGMKPGGLPMESTGGHIGVVAVELVDPAERDITSQQILKEWRELFGDFPGTQSIKFQSTAHGPGGIPIEFRLLARADRFGQLEKAVEEVKAKLGQYAGVFDIADDSLPGKWEYQLSIKESAKSMNVKLADLAETVRSSYYGSEVMRLQRGRHEIKLMVRYPPQERNSLAHLEEIRVRLDDGAERPLTELADIQIQQSLAEINRVDQLRSIKITADVDEAEGNAQQIVRDLQANFIPGLLKKYPGMTVRWEGQQQQTVESIQSLMIGFAVALVLMFVVLTVEFRSYLQPLLIMAIIPFGLVGAVLGHALMGLPFTMFSLFGLVALTGVVVNDSIVLIDFINHRVRDDGRPLLDALVDAGRSRLRAIVLTSITTVAGLTPLILERSFQAQVIVPMAVSLVFGLMTTTIFVLYLIPSFYAIYGRLFLPEARELGHAVDGEIEQVPVRFPVTISANGHGEYGEKREVAWQVTTRDLL